jgi:HK97 family phage major capsid protein
MTYSNAANQPDFAQTKDDIFSGFITPELAQDYFAAAQRTSVVQQLARKVPLGPSGQKVPHFNKSNVQAAWVEEGAPKPTTKGALSLQYIQPHKIAAIIVDSAEVVRLNPGNYITHMQAAVGEAIGKAFDDAVLHGTGSPFTAVNGLGQAQNLDATTKAQELASLTAYDDLAVDGLTQLVTHKNADGAAYRWTGTALDVVTEPLLNAAKDNQGRPLFNEPVYNGQVSPVRGGSILSRPTFVTDQIAKGTGTGGALQAGDTYGYMGDFSQMVWGQIGGISYSVSNEASVTLGGELVSLWQHNLIAILVEAEYGLLINDLNAFVKLTVPVSP